MAAFIATQPLSVSVFVSPASLSAAAQPQAQHVFREKWTAALETAVPTYLPDHTARMIFIHHRLAALAPIERPRVRLDDTDGGSLSAHTERDMQAIRWLRQWSFRHWCRARLTLLVPPR